MKYPKPFESLIESLRKLPGVGAKTAERYAFHMLDWKEQQIQGFIEAIDQTYHQLRDCKVCGNLTVEEVCHICADVHRDHTIICVVTNVKDIIAIEKTNEFHGVYHVLKGEISASKGKLPDDIRLKELVQRIDDSTQEVIIATNPTVDGETTALYLIKLLEHKQPIISRLAHGLPMGGYLDYADELTLIKAMEGRKKVKGLL